VPAGRSTINKRRHMESSITLGEDTTVMKTTNQANYNTYTKRTDRRQIVGDTKDVQTAGAKSTTSTTDSKTLADGTIVTTTKHVTKTTSGTQRTQQTGQVGQTSDVRKEVVRTEGPQPSTVSRREVVSANEIQKSSSQTHVRESHHHSHVQQNNIINTSHQDISSRQQSGNHVTKTESHHRRNVMQTEADISNQVLHRKAAHTSTEALHATSSAALAQRKSISNLHDQGHYSAQSSDRRSLSAIHRSNVQQDGHRRGQEWSSATYTYERPQKIVRQDNLSVGGHFYGQSEAHSYGSFTKQQNVQKVERVTRRSNVSNISLGETNVNIVTSYKNEYGPRRTGPCPAALVDAPKGPFKHTRDTKTHKFYMPVVSN